MGGCGGSCGPVTEDENSGRSGRVVSAWFCIAVDGGALVNIMGSFFSFIPPVSTQIQ